MCVLQEQCTPLYIASAKGFNDVVKSLIAAKANVNCVSEVRKLLHMFTSVVTLHIWLMAESLF